MPSKPGSTFGRFIVAVASRAISGNDYFVIQGVVLFVILSVGLALLILDLVYPLLDPRIQFRKA